MSSSLQKQGSRVVLKSLSKICGRPQVMRGHGAEDHLATIATFVQNPIYASQNKICDKVYVLSYAHYIWVWSSTLP